jgi:hypothetical protein
MITGADKHAPLVCAPQFECYLQQQTQDNSSHISSENQNPSLLSHLFQQTLDKDHLACTKNLTVNLCITGDFPWHWSQLILAEPLLIVE